MWAGQTYAEPLRLILQLLSFVRKMRRSPVMCLWALDFALGTRLDTCGSTCWVSFRVHYRSRFMLHPQVETCPKTPLCACSSEGQSLVNNWCPAWPTVAYPNHPWRITELAPIFYKLTPLELYFLSPSSVTLGAAALNAPLECCDRHLPLSCVPTKYKDNPFLPPCHFFTIYHMWLV